jgi:PhnB protein
MSEKRSFSPYLFFPGNAEEACLFYKKAFGGEFSSVMRYKDVEGQEFPPDAAEKLMHISLPISEGLELMASDSIDSMGSGLVTGNNFAISIDVQSRKEADRLFEQLSSGGKVQSAMKEEFWGSYFGMLTDRFRIQWMISSK